MRFLIDTHVLLWWVADAARLSPTADVLLRNPASQIVLSVVTPWEMALKAKKGQLGFRDPVDVLVNQCIGRFNLEVLPIKLEHAFACLHLPPYHADPFDRMLIGQAHSENISLMTADVHIARYNTPIIW